MTHGVVTPNIVAPTSGRASGRAGTSTCAIAAIAAAAFARIRSEIALIPAMSTTEYVIDTSTAPTYGRVSPEAIVETISFGTPTGSARIARVAIDVPPEPPSARIPWSRPSSYSRRTTASAPRAIVSTASPRSVSAARSAPAAAATSAAGTSGSASGGPPLPASTSSTSAPSSRRRPRRNSYSSPFVSSVPSRTTVGMRTLLPYPLVRWSSTSQSSSS